MARKPFSRQVEAAIQGSSRRFSIDPSLMRAIAKVESNGNPRAQTGSYSGLFQLSPNEFRRAGGQGDIYDPHANATAAGTLFRQYTDQFTERHGRAPTPGELYMIHQQGQVGFDAHSRNPEGRAIDNMASTREGRQRIAAGDTDWPRRAIMGNTLPEFRRQYGDNITSGQFMQMWNQRLAREMPPAEGLTPGAAIVDASGGSIQPGQVSPNAPDIGRDIASDRLQADIAATPGPRPFFETSGLQAGLESVAGQIQQPTVAGLSAGAILPGLGGGGGGVGAALSAAGKAIAASGPKIPPMEDPGRLMAALDPGGQWPTIPTRPRRQVGPGRG